MTLSLEILSPTKVLVREMVVDEVVCPAQWGQIDVLPGHADYVTTLVAGEIIYRIGSTKKSTTISGGILCVEAQKITATVET